MERTLKSLLLVVLILVAISSFYFLTLKPTVPEINLTTPERPTVTNVTFPTVYLNVPAVDEEGKGVATTLIVEAKPGKGRVMVDINQLLFWVDTQYSIRVAKIVAQNYTKLDLSDVDLTYAIETNASIIGGPSAGGALAVATIAVVENKTINPSVMITGTIGPDGSIGPVGAIVEKAKAAKDIGATLFLVPEGQSVQTYYKPVQTCKKIGPMTYCSIEYEAEKIDVSEDVGIDVKEVSNIEEALKYFLT